MIQRVSDLPNEDMAVYWRGRIGAMANSQAVLVKVRSVLRAAGHSDGEHGREYKDWHIEVHGGLAYLSVWTSAGMVFLSLSDIVVFHRPGPWEQYLDLLFQKRVD